MTTHFIDSTYMIIIEIHVRIYVFFIYAYKEVDRNLAIYSSVARVKRDWRMLKNCFLTLEDKLYVMFLVGLAN